MNKNNNTDAIQDDHTAQYNLAKYYHNGWDNEIDLEKAFYWYQKSAKNENHIAQCNLAICYRYSLAENENNIAQYKLGYFYENSIEIKGDLKKAFYWYQKSAINKNKDAYYNIIKCYINGIGINKDLEKAYEWHQKLIINENKSKRNFGISKIGNNSTIHIGLCGKTAYIEPQILINHNFQYIKPSDIYSYGVLMWEISSGYPPFKDLNDATICALINNKAHFGISKIENNSTLHIVRFGKTAYMEPQILADQNFQYIKASDIYSFGVLMWEISSGHPPFEDKFNNNQDLIVAITCYKAPEYKNVKDGIVANKIDPSLVYCISLNNTSNERNNTLPR
ncbi:12386_t:CDS:2 [Funneliformis geosporum]|nr:12386_t:CDS:2 [Funneliformis geosporum]